MNLKCDYCKGKGHTNDQCFKLIGFPYWYHKKPTNITFGGKLVAHVVADNIIEDTPHDFDASGPSTTRIGGHSMANHVDTAVIHTMFREFLNTMQGKQAFGESFESQTPTARAHFAGINSSYTWKVDSGATDHMAYGANLFSSKKNLIK